MSAVSKMALKRKNLLEKIKEEKNPNKIVEYIQESNIEIDHRIIAEDVLSPFSGTCFITLPIQRFCFYQHQFFR